MDRVEKIAALQTLFECAPAAAAALEPHFHWTTIPKGQIIAHQGSFEKRCWLVAQGQIDVRAIGLEGQYVQIASFEAGQFLGAFPEPMENPADLAAARASNLFEIDSIAFVRLIADHGSLAHGLAQLLGRQIHDLVDRVISRETLSANGRVYRELLRRADENGRISPPPVISGLAMRVQTSRETASRAINAAERRGIIQRRDDAMLILAPRMLADLVI
jgi:CRP-like cAMP-binding protein